MTANLSPFWVGTITENTDQPWSGTVRVGGDVIVPAGVTLEIAANTVIQFIADTDDTDAVAGEMDTGRSELIVQGTLTASAGGIIFRSTHDDPDDADWYGIRVLPGGHVDLSNASLHDGVRCVSNEGGSLTLNDNTTFDNCGTLLWISGNSTPTFPENRETQEVVATYTAQDASGNAVAVAWSLDPDASETFTIDSEGQLRFQHSPDFEALNDEPIYNVTIQAEDSPSAAVAELRVAVTVENVDEEGMVTVMPTTPREDGSLSPPRVGEELTAELKDLDGVLPLTTGWAWWAGSTLVHWALPDPDGEVTESGGVTNSYTPQPEDVDRALKVVVTYADGHSDGKEMSATTAPVEGDPVMELDGPESLTFVEHGTFVADGEEVVPTYTVSGVDGAVTWSLDGLDAAAFDLETDSGGGRSLSFSEPPNFEAPTDTDEGGPNTYHVTVVATLTEASSLSEDSLADLMAAFQRLSDDSSSAQVSSSALTQAVVVTVEDGDDPGVVSLPTGPPRVGTPLTAVLEEEDGPLPGTTTWTWQSAESAAGSWTDVSGVSLATSELVGATVPYPELDEYTPTSSDVGRVLRVWVNYEDGFGPKAVASAPTAAVQAAGEVSLTPAQPRVGQPVTARLAGPEEAVTGAAWSWWRRQQDTDDWALLGSSAPAAAEESSSAFADMFRSLNWGSTEVSSYTPTVADLGYRLQARVAWEGQAAASAPSAPVQAGMPCAPGSFAGEGADGTDGDGAVVLSWNTPCNNGSAITGYEVQYRLEGTTTWNPSWTPIDGSTQATTSHRVDGLASGQIHTFEVRAVNAEGAGSPARTTATAESFNSAPVISCDPPFPVPILENTGGTVSTCRADDAEGDLASWQLTGPDAARFWFPNRRLTLKQPLDFEDPLDHDGDQTYQLHLIARDSRDQTLADTLAVTVWLLNEDEPPTLYGQSQRSMLENRTGFVASYYAVDPEDEDLTWSLSGPDHSLFGLTPTGAKNTFALLTLEHALNFESTLDANEDNIYELYVEVSDTGHQTQLAVYVRVAHQVGKDVAVQVLDENEPPSILGARQFSFPENATGALETYYGFDPEGSPLRWSLRGQTGPFSIDAKSGRLRVQNEMDYETAPQDVHGERAYALRIIATDEHPQGALSSDIAGGRGRCSMSTSRRCWRGRAMWRSMKTTPM